MHPGVPCFFFPPSSPLYFLARCQRKLTMRLRLPNVPHLQLAKQLAPKPLLPSVRPCVRVCVRCKWVYFYFICCCACVFVSSRHTFELGNVFTVPPPTSNNKNNSTRALVYLSQSFELFQPLVVAKPRGLNERRKQRKIVCIYIGSL